MQHKSDLYFFYNFYTFFNGNNTTKLSYGSELVFDNYRFSAFWLRSKCSICSYQLNIWYGLHSRSRILNWFLTDWIHGWACSPGPAGCRGIALPPWAASFFPQDKPSFAYCCLRKIYPVYPNPYWVRNFSTNKPLSFFCKIEFKESSFLLLSHNASFLLLKKEHLHEFYPQMFKN